MRAPADRTWIVAAGYLAAMLLYIYGIANPSVGVDSDTATVIVFGGLVLLHLATGWLANRLWAVLLPVAAVLLSIPAGTPQEGWEPYPIWFGLAVAVPVGMLLIFAGFAAHRIVRPQTAA